MPIEQENLENIKTLWLDKNKFRLIVISTIIISSLFTYLVIYPFVAISYQKLNQEISTYRSLSDFKDGVTLGEQLKRSSEVLNKVTNNLSSVPKEGYSSYALSKLWELADKEGLALSDVHALDKIVSDTYIEYPFEIKSTGDYNKLLSYLLELENETLTVKIRSILIETVAINKPEIEFQIELSFYVLQ